MALAVAVGPGIDAYRSGGVEPHLGGFPKTDAGPQGPDHRRGSDSAGFNVGGHADAAKFAVGFGLRPARGKARVVDHLHRRVERGLVVADVVGQRHRRIVRELVWLNEVPATQFGWIDAQLAGRHLDDALDHIGGLGSPRATVGVHR